MQFLLRRPFHSCLAILLAVLCLPLIASGGEPRRPARPKGLNTFTVDIFVPAVPQPAADECEFKVTTGLTTPACGECGQQCQCRTAECPACPCRGAISQPSRPLENDNCGAAREILELRKALGGSVLEGTEFHDASSAVSPSAVIDFRGGNRCEFAEADSAAVVRQIRYLEMQQSQDDADENCVENPGPSTYTPAIAIEGIPGRRYPDDYTDHLIHAPRSADHGQRIQALREAGRCLDQAAERLEEIELYDRADQLRGQAQVLRREARGH